MEAEFDSWVTLPPQLLLEPEISVNTTADKPWEGPSDSDLTEFHSMPIPGWGYTFDSTSHEFTHDFRINRPLDLDTRSIDDLTSTSSVTAQPAIYDPAHFPDSSSWAHTMPPGTTCTPNTTDSTTPDSLQSQPGVLGAAPVGFTAGPAGPLASTHVSVRYQREMIPGTYTDATRAMEPMRPGTVDRPYLPPGMHSHMAVPMKAAGAAATAAAWHSMPPGLEISHPDPRFEHSTPSSVPPLAYAAQAAAAVGYPLAPPPPMPVTWGMPDWSTQPGHARFAVDVHRNAMPMLTSAGPTYTEQHAVDGGSPASIAAATDSTLVTRCQASMASWRPSTFSTEALDELRASVATLGTEWFPGSRRVPGPGEAHVAPG